MAQQDGLQCLRDLTADQLEKVPYSPTTLTFATLAPNDVLYLPPACIFLEKSAVTDNVTLRCSTLIFSSDTLVSFDMLSASYPKLLGCNWWYAKGNRLISLSTSVFLVTWTGPGSPDLCQPTISVFFFRTMFSCVWRFRNLCNHTMSKMARALLDAQVNPALAEGDGDETEPVPGDGAASKVPATPADAEEKGTEEDEPDEPEPDDLSLGQASESDAESCRENGDDDDGGDGSCGNGDDNERPPVEATSATCPSTAAESNADDPNRASQVTQGGGNLAAAPPEEAVSAGAGMAMSLRVSLAS